MPLSALSAAVLACLQHLCASLVPSVHVWTTEQAEVPAAQNVRPGLHLFGPRPLRPQRHAIAPCHATETIIRDGACDGSIGACARAARNQSCKRGLIERTARAGAIACCGISPMPRIQKPRIQKSLILKSPIVRHGIIALGSALWLAGLWAQFHSLSAAATYVVISLLMLLAVVATSGRPINRASSD
jgi:hypothetical protein